MTTSRLAKIMPPALQSSPIWRDLAEATSTVWDNLVESQIASLKALQSTWIKNNDTQESIASGILIDSATGFDTLDLNLVQKELQSLGINIRNPDNLSNIQLNTLYRTIGKLWRQKGRAATIDYVAAALGVTLISERLWTEDYVDFTPEPTFGNPPGTPIWEGGTWYPTTHIQITYDPTTSVSSLQVLSLVQLLYMLCSYTVIIRILIPPVLLDFPNKITVGLISSKTEYLGVPT